MIVWRLIALLFSLQFSQPAKSDSCVWYGQSETSSGQILNKKYDGPPKRADAQLLSLLKKQCPHLISNSTTSVCCDADQVQELISRASPIGTILGRCSPCVFNLYAYFCEFTCSPKQSEFLEALSVDKDNLIEEIRYRVNKDYLDKVIESCRDVSYSSGGQKALSYVCGSSQCDAQALVSQFASMSPFKTTIELVQAETGEKSMFVPKVLACNETTEFPTANLTLESCACLDCESSCARKCDLEPYSTHTFSIYNYSGYTVVSLAVATIIISLVLTYLLYQYARTKSANSPIVDERTRFLDEQSASLPKSVRIIAALSENLARLVCRFPKLAILQALLVCGFLLTGFPQIRTSTDPNVIWSVKNSRALENAQHFRAHFEEPFVRTLQMILVPRDKRSWIHLTENDFFGVHFSSVFQLESLESVFELESEIENLRTDSEVTLDSVCLKPLSPANNKCTLLSISQYFQRNLTLLQKTIEDPFSAPKADFATHIAYCIEHPFSTLDPGFGESCLGDFGGPAEPVLILGSNGDPRLSPITNSTALIVTIPLRDDDHSKEAAMEWELKFIEFVRSKKDFPFEIVYSTERSIEDEIRRESWTDVGTLAISYALMFAYVVVSLTLTTVRRPLERHYTITEKVNAYLTSLRITIGFTSVAFVMVAVAASVGFFAWLHVPTTLLIFEVVPFLILAVGVDNVFIVMQHLYRVRLNPETSTHSDMVALTLKQVGPGMAMSTLAEVSAFAFAAILARQYAIRLFALYALVALILNIYIQSTVLVPIIMFDLKRTLSRRLDLLCCLKLGSDPDEVVNSETDENDELTERIEIKESSVFERYSSLLLNNSKSGEIRLIAIFLFTLFFVVSLCSLQSIKIGLDPKTSLPRDSYLVQYLKAVEEHLQAGPPYFIVVSDDQKSLNLSDLGRQNALCGSRSCDPDSLMNRAVNYANCPANISFLGTSPSSWIDGYIDWVNTPEKCCRKLPNNSVCPNNEPICVPCQLNRTNDGRLIGPEFEQYLPHFLADIPDPNMCSLGGKALFGSSLMFNDEGEVSDCNFRGYHSPLKSSEDFINALRRAWTLADELARDLKLKFESDSVRVYIHSVFYVFYEQYLTIVLDSVLNVVCPLLLVALISLFCTGFNWRASAAFLMTIVMILTELTAIISWIGVELNAVSLVNLVMSIGIAVEFCAHQTMHFVQSKKANRVEKALDSLTTVGSSVLTGVALTKVTGIVVLAFAKSELFSLYFFKMYASLILVSTLNALVMLPCLLATVGGGSDKREETENVINNVREDDLIQDEA